MKFAFVVVVLIWTLFGFLGIYFNNDVTDTGFKSGIFFGLFLAMVPALPLIASLCGLI